MCASSVALSRLVGLTLLIVMGVMWGNQFAMLKLAAEHGLSEINILTIALILLSVIITAILVARRKAFPVTIGRSMFLIVIGLLGYVIPLAAALHVAPHIPAGILTLVSTLAPVTTISIALLLRTGPVLRCLAPIKSRQDSKDFRGGWSLQDGQSPNRSTPS